MKTKHSVHIMVFGVVISDGDFMRLFIFPYGLRIHMEVYIKCLEKIMLPCIKRVSIGRSYVCQQKCAACHTSWRTQSCLSEGFCDNITRNIWLFYSADFNPLNSFVRGAFEREANKTPCNNNAEMKAAMTAVFTNSNKETVREGLLNITNLAGDRGLSQRGLY